MINSIKKFFGNIRRMCINTVHNFKNRDIWYKLTYFIMGTHSIKHKQYHRGISYLLIQIGYWVYMFTSGFSVLGKLDNLGEVVTEEIFNESTGVFEQTFGDNSMLILLYGVLTIIMSIIVFGIYLNNIKNANDNEERILKDKKPKTFKEEVADYKDSKFHITITAIPILSITTFIIVPLIFMILIAFTNYDKSHQPPGTLFTWVGLENFYKLFGKSEALSNTFVKLFGWTMIWAVCATFLNYILGMILALIINKEGIKLKSFWRTMFVITIAVPQFVSLLLMSKLLNDVGSLNQIIQLFGGDTIKFLSNGSTAKVTVIIVNLWIGIPFTMLSTMGILMNIPKDLYEAARIDGASTVQQFKKITWPYMSYVMTPYLITTFIGNLNNFNVIYLLTGGGPESLNYYQAGETDILITWLFNITTSTDFDYGLASTIGIVIFIITATFSLIAFNSSKSVKSEDEFR